MTQPAISQDTIVTTWLEAESDSPRFAPQLHAKSKNAVQIIKEANPSERMKLLAAVRGRQVSNFPWAKVAWQEYQVNSKEELGGFRTCPGLSWLAFTNGDRLLATAAAWISKQPKSLDPHKNVAGVQEKIAKNIPLPSIIAYIAENGSRVLLEGHVRAVSYYLSAATTYPLSIFLGTSATPKDFKTYDAGLNLSEIRELFLKEEL